MVARCSRIVFLAVPLALVLMVVLQQLQAVSGPTRLPGAAPSPGVDRLGTAALLLLGVARRQPLRCSPPPATAPCWPCWAASACCRYRGGNCRPCLKLLALAVTLLLGPLLPLGALAVPKGPYQLCGALLLLGLVAALLAARAGKPAALLVGAAVLAVFGGGADMTGRLAEVDGDERGRMQHWREALQRLPNEPARWWGVGLGRFLDHYAIGAAPADRPGDMRLVLADGQPAMRIATSKQDMRWGRLLRLSQRIQRPLGQLTARITLRTPDRPPLHLDVCIKHLLYDDGCQAAQLQVLSKGVAPGAWQTVSLPLSAKPLPLDAWYAPRFTVFSLSAESATQPIEVREISIRDASGRELLDNRSFERGGARWFFSSDRNHMPWHAKNMAVHLLIEQGYLGLAALALLSVAALTRLTLGRARRYPLAPAVAGALLGFWVVGAVDSLLDMPRVATLFLLLTAVGLSLRDSRPR